MRNCQGRELGEVVVDSVMNQDLGAVLVYRSLNLGCPWFSPACLQLMLGMLGVLAMLGQAALAKPASYSEPARA